MNQLVNDGVGGLAGSVPDIEIVYVGVEPTVQWAGSGFP
jgi:hypothetical protein